MAFIALGIKDIWLLIKWYTIRNGVCQCWVKVEESKVSGFTTDESYSPQSVHSFEILVKNIRSVDVLELDVANRACFTLRINHKDGSTQVPVDDSTLAAKNIMEIVSK